MADYKHVGKDPVYGYIEEISFVPLNKQCDVVYKEPYDNDPKLDLVDSLATQDFVEEKNLTLPNCKCLRK